MLSLEKQNHYREQYRQKNPGWQPGTERFAQLVRERLHPHARILDIGCGRGGLVEQLTHPHSKMVGIDPDWLSLTEHRLGIPRAVGFSDALPFAANSFDVVFASWVLEHLERPLRTFRSISHCLKPGGVFVFITPNGRHPLSTLNNLLGRFSRLQGQLVEQLYGRADHDAFPTFYRANNSKQISQLATDANLTLSALYPIADPTYLAFNNTLFRAMCNAEKLIPASRKLHLVGVLQRNHA